MLFKFTDDKPLYIQIAQQLEDAIFIGVYKSEEQIPSTTELSVSLQINPATVLKGMNILVDEGIIYKKRGLGMYVSPEAVKIITEKRQKSFSENFIEPLVSEAKKLGMNKEQIIKLIEGGLEK